MNYNKFGSNSENILKEELLLFGYEIQENEMKREKK